MMERGYEAVVVFEDDLRFEPYFRTKLNRIMTELHNKQYEWDLMSVTQRSFITINTRFCNIIQNLYYKLYIGLGSRIFH